MTQDTPTMRNSRHGHCAEVPTRDCTSKKDRIPADDAADPFRRPTRRESSLSIGVCAPEFIAGHSAGKIDIQSLAAHAASLIAL